MLRAVLPDELEAAKIGLQEAEKRLDYAEGLFVDVAILEVTAAERRFNAVVSEYLAQKS